MRPNAILVALLLGLLPVASPAQVVGSPAYEFVATEMGVKAVGRWSHKMERGRAFLLSATNSAEVHCSRASMSCWESRAELVTAADTRRAPNLTVKTTPFKITEWSDARITARADDAGGDLMLRIDVKGRQVQLTYWD